MDNKARRPANMAISISMSKELLAAIDARAHRLGMRRTTYLVQLARMDVLAGGNLALQETGAAGMPRVNPSNAGAVMNEMRNASARPPRSSSDWTPRAKSLRKK